MIKDNIEFHNVAELEDDRAGGFILYRIPRTVRHSLSQRGRFVSEEASGCEIRFVTEANFVRLTLLSQETDGEITVYKGGMVHSRHRLRAGIAQTLQLEEPERLKLMARETLLQSGFAPEVWRICLGRHTCVFRGLNTFGYPVRPPHPQELPDLKWVMYGSSITHGLSNNQLSYVYQAARRLRADVYNLGLGGSCHCEKKMADFIAERDDWDIAALELGINMRALFTTDQFKERTQYLLERLVSLHPNKPVFAINIYPNFATGANDETGVKEQAFNEILREHVRRMNHPSLHLIEGSTVLQDMSGLSCDMVHPGENGHASMGENLAVLIGSKLERL